MTTSSPRDCRSCHAPLDPFLDLGAIQLSGYLAPEEAGRPMAPLVVAACTDCRLVQLLHTTPRDLLFSHYWYRSGVNEVMRAELRDVVDDAIRRVDLKGGDVVVDTGANDGTLLARYQDHQPHLWKVAYEPAANLQGLLQPHADQLVADYFPQQFQSLERLERRVKIITSIAMFYAVDEVHPFLAAVKRLLHEDGVWVVQFQDLASMIRASAFDNICHEHLVYYSVSSFAQLIAPYGLVVARVEGRAINGGSLRLMVRHAGYVPHLSVHHQVQRERHAQSWAGFEQFVRRVEETKRQIGAVLQECRERGQVIDLYGASTKANTLLQVCGLDRTVIRQAWERSPEKWGRRTAGTDIPIVSEADGRADPPNALLVGIWQFRDAVVAREAAFLDSRGVLIFPLPAVDIVSVRKERDRVGA